MAQNEKLNLELGYFTNLTDNHWIFWNKLCMFGVKRGLVICYSTGYFNPLILFVRNDSHTCKLLFDTVYCRISQSLQLIMMYILYWILLSRYYVLVHVFPSLTIPVTSLVYSVIKLLYSVNSQKLLVYMVRWVLVRMKHAECWRVPWKRGQV